MKCLEELLRFFRLLAVDSQGVQGVQLPPVETRNPRVLGSSEPTSGEPLRRGGAGRGLGQTLSTGNRGVQGEPVQKILRSTYILAGLESYVSNAVSSLSPTTMKRCRDKSPFGGEHSPFTVLTGLVVFKTTTKGLVVTTPPPSSSDHRVPAAYAATAGGFWVLPDEYRNLGDDSRKNASSFSAMTGSTANPPYCISRRLFERISHISNMKVDTDLEVDPRLALLVFSVLQTTSGSSTYGNPLFEEPEHKSCGTACSIDWKIGPRANTNCSFGLEFRLCKRACRRR